jgi:hypothetical protein
MADHPDAPDKVRFRAEHTPSFLIESLVYNCPDHLFGNQEIYDDVVAVLRYLNAGLNDRSDGRTLLALPIWAFWYEVNGIKLDLVEVIERKVRRAAEPNQAFVSVRDLFELVV